MTTKKGAVQEYLNKELDSFTWIKKAPREVLEKELKQFRVKPVFKTDAWDHQLACWILGMTFPEFLFLLDMGMGKTWIGLNIFIQLLREKKVTKGIVTVPRLINLGSWEEAVKKHTDLSVTLVEGSIADKYEQLLHPTSDLTVIDYAGLQLALSKKVKGKLVTNHYKAERVAKNFQIFIPDETHKARNGESKRYALLSGFSKRIKYHYGMTGTLFGRNPEEIFAQFELIDRGETFGNSLGLFREAFFTAKFNGFGNEYIFNKDMYRTLFRFIQHRSIRYAEWENPNIPKHHFEKLLMDFGSEQREYYFKALQGLIEAKGNPRQLDAPYIRMKQITAGFLRWNEGDDKHKVVFDENPKLDMLVKVITNNPGSSFIVSHEFTDSGHLITKRLQELGIGYEWLYGGSKDKKHAVRRFLEDGSKEVFVMNSESGGTGTDGLQEKASILIFYESPESPLTRQQVIKRIVRPGNKKSCYIYDLVMRRSADAKILKFYEEGKSLHEAIVDGSFDVRQLKFS